MATTNNQTPVIFQGKRSSDRRKLNTPGRAEYLVPRAGLYKRVHNNNARNIDMNISDQFVRACENGDYSTVRRILEENNDFNIDVTNQLGRTAIQLAIENEHLEVVTLLLEYCDGQKIREVILLAIYLGHVQIAETCLRHRKFRVLNERRAITDNADSFWGTPSSDDAQFAPDITPLILAAQYNRTEIVQLLLKQGDRITKPHDYHCKCNDCRNRFKFDSLHLAQSRLNAYRGLASESYISLASIDPILTAFELGRELRDLSGKEKYFKNEYMKLADQLSAYAVKLLDKVRGHEELDYVLRKTGKESEEKYRQLARLYLAIKYKEKPFVAHSNCQQKLVEIWHSEIRDLFKLNPLLILLLTFSYVFILPFACIFYILTSWSNYTSKFQRFLKQPYIKFLGHTISYGIFIVLIIVSSLLFANDLKKPTMKLSDDYTTVHKALQNSKQEENTYSNCSIYPIDDLVFRASSPTPIDIIISIFVIGFLWREIKQAYNDGIRDYLLSWNNIADSCTSVLYLSSFALRYYVIYRVVHATRMLSDPKFQIDVGRICGLDKPDQLKIYETFYWLNADRYFWISFDPINVAEGLFAIANVFSFSRICFFLPAFQHLGPLQISLGRMMSDIGKFIIIFLIIFCGFMFGLNNLFWYYKKSVRSNVEITSHREDGDELQAEECFGTITATFKTIFWALFGLAEKDGVQLDDFDKRFTETVGYLIYGAFSITSVIVLLNMLIAMMSKSYETIVEHADVEWKFARSKLYMEYIKQGGTLPVPFNIIPTPKGIHHFCRRTISFVKKLRDSTNEQTSADTSQPPLDRSSNNGSFNANQKLTYRKVMDRVIKRFLLHKQRKEQEEIREGDFGELKQDIQMLRFELLNRLEDTRTDLYKNTHLLNEGVLIVGDLLSLITNNTNPLIKENFHLFKKSVFSRTDSGIESNTSTLSRASITTLNQPTQTSRSMLNSNSAPSLLMSTQDESDLNLINAVKNVTVAHIRLTEIVEEEEQRENLQTSSKYMNDDDDEEEVEARHISVQTLRNDDEKYISKF